MYKILSILLFAYGLCLDNSTENNETVPNVLPSDDLDLLIFEHIILDDWTENEDDYLNFYWSDLYASDYYKMIEKIVHEKLSIVINPNNIRIEFHFENSVEKLFKSQWEKDDYKKNPEEIINDINIWIGNNESTFGEFDYSKRTIITRIFPYFDFNTALRYKTKFKKYQLLHNDLAIDKVYAKFMQDNQFINDQEELQIEVDGYLLFHGEGTFNILIDQQIKPHPTDMIKDIMINLYPHLQHCDDCISFTSVDMDSLRGVNENVKSTISLQRDDIYDDSWAVIIGIDKYKYSDQLNYAVKDAEAVKDMLINKFDYPEENIRYLVDDEATLSGIKIALEDIATVAEDNDRILVFYSGHGETLKGNDGTETGYIIPIEGRQDKPYSTGLAMDDILRTCQMSKSKHMLFLMDACYSGLMTENVKGVSKPQEEGYLSKVANEKARQIITAGGKNEQVIERDEWQHSAFTKNLLAGLDDWESDTDEDGYITADELGTYLRKSVTEDSDFQQTPQKGRFRNSGGGEFVFFSNHNAINQNVEDKSTDEKLDYLISEMEELKSQQSSDDMKKWTTNKGLKALLPRQSLSEDWYEKYRYGGYGFVIATFEDAYSINLSIERNQEWGYGFAYSQIGNKTIKRLITIKDGHSITSTGVGVGVHPTYFINDDLYINMVCGVGYNMINWEDKEQNTSGKFSKINVSFSPQINLNIHEREQPLPIRVHLNFGIYFGYFPSSYKIDNEIVKLDDWKIRIFPVIAIGFSLPNHKL